MRGQYEGYREIDGVAEDSTTETYAALRLEIDNWRWSGVPFFIRTGKHLPVTQTELRLVFKHPPRLGFGLRGSEAPSPTSSWSSSTPPPASGCWSTPSAATRAKPEQINLDMEFAEEGGEGADALRGAAARGDDRRQQALHPPGRRRGDLAGHAAAARLAAAGPRLREGIVGPGGGRQARRRPRRLARPVGRVMTHAPRRSAAPERGRAVAVPADRRLRVPLQLPHRRARRARRGGRLALRAALRLAERVRHACSTAQAGALPARAVRHQRPDGAHLRARDEHRSLTTWKTPTGWILVRDALTMGPRDGEDEITPHTRPPADDDGDHMLVRTVALPRGRGRGRAGLRAGLRLRARRRPSGRWSTATATPPTPPAPTRRSGCRPTWRSASRATGCGPGTRSSRASRLYCSLSWAEDLAAPQDVDEANARLAATTRFWRAWLGRARLPDHRWREPIQRSALAIKGLTYMPTGATVAALTTSLPETPGGERNWDYRYTWMRDSTFTLQALHFLNLDWEADEFMQFVADLEPNEDGALQIMYGIDGRRDLTESTRDDLSGYAGARPGADRQRRLRPAPERRLRRGARLDPAAHAAAASACRGGCGRSSQAQAECATEVWREPDQGIWEARGEPQHYVSSKLMCWVALDRAAKLAEIRGDPELDETWRATADEIKARHPRARRHATACCASTTTPTRSTPRRCWRRSSASCPATTSACARASMAIADDLTEDGFVLRYRTDETDDGLSGKEGSFLICSFWLVSALAIVGEQQRARDLMERLLQRRLAARPLRRGVRHRAPAATSATSRRPSRTSR